MKNATEDSFVIPGMNTEMEAPVVEVPQVKKVKEEVKVEAPAPKPVETTSAFEDSDKAVQDRLSDIDRLLQELESKK